MPSVSVHTHGGNVWSTLCAEMPCVCARHGLAGNFRAGGAALQSVCPAPPRRLTALHESFGVFLRAQLWGLPLHHRRRCSHLAPRAAPRHLAPRSAHSASAACTHNRMKGQRSAALAGAACRGTSSRTLYSTVHKALAYTGALFCALSELHLGRRPGPRKRCSWKQGLLYV